MLRSYIRRFFQMEQLFSIQVNLVAYYKSFIYHGHKSMYSLTKRDQHLTLDKTGICVEKLLFTKEPHHIK